VLADDQVAFPVTGNCTVGNLGWTLFNGQHVGYFAAHFDDVPTLMLPWVFAFWRPTIELITTLGREAWI